MNIKLIYFNNNINQKIILIYIKKAKNNINQKSTLIEIRYKLIIV